MMLIATVPLMISTVMQSGLAFSLHKGTSLESNTILQKSQNDAQYIDYNKIRSVKPTWLDFDLDDIFNQINDGIKGLYGTNIPPIVQQYLDNLHRLIGRSTDTFERRSRGASENKDYDLQDIFNTINDKIKGYAIDKGLRMYLGKQYQELIDFQNSVTRNKVTQ